MALGGVCVVPRVQLVVVRERSFRRHVIGTSSHMRFDDRIVHADRALVQAAERHHRRTGALGTEAWERLGVASHVERGYGKQFGGRDHPLAATAVNADLEHAARLKLRPTRGCRRYPAWTERQSAAAWTGRRR
jgi:hypothetical protein